MPNRTERPKARVFLVDDHALVREHLTALIQEEPDLEVCGEAADAPTALALMRQQEPDLLILDISLKRSNGLDLLKEVKQLWPKLTVLVLSMHDELLYAERALGAGATGYITKEQATVSILSAIRQVLAGHVYLSDRMAERIMQEHANTGGGAPGSPLEVLTKRESEVFDRIGRGMATRHIGVAGIATSASCNAAAAIMPEAGGMPCKERLQS